MYFGDIVVVPAEYPGFEWIAQCVHGGRCVWAATPREAAQALNAHRLMRSGCSFEHTAFLMRVSPDGLRAAIRTLAASLAPHTRGPSHE